MQDFRFCDQAVERATSAGAKVLMPLTNQFWGDRTAWIMDPQGHVWSFAHTAGDDISTISWPAIGGVTYTDQFTYASSTHAILTHTDRRSKVHAGVAFHGVRGQGEAWIEALDEDPGAPAHSSGTPAGCLGGTFLASNPSSRSKSFSSLKSL